MLKLFADGPLARAQPRLARWPATAEIFLKPNGDAPAVGDILRQMDLAASLAVIAAAGPAAFYRGPIARRIIASLRAAGGILVTDDLANYRARERTPVHGTYRGLEILSMPPPSSVGCI